MNNKNTHPARKQAIKITSASFVFFVFAAVLLLLSASASASQDSYILLEFGNSSSDFTISVIEDTLYYQPYLFRGSLPESPDYTVRLLDLNSNALQEHDAYISENNVYDFDNGIQRIEIYQDGEFISGRQISFCNSNGICEPCSGPGCTLIENSLTCLDCPSGAEDYFCDLVQDGICDPDCEGHDKDCESCTQDCWYEDSVLELTSCTADLGGIICDPGQRCTGDFAYADDSGSLCCLQGACTDADADELAELEAIAGTAESSQNETSGQQPEGQEEQQDGPENFSPLWIALPLLLILIAAGYFLLRKRK